MPQIFTQRVGLLLELPRPVAAAAAAAAVVPAAGAAAAAAASVAHPHVGADGAGLRGRRVQDLLEGARALDAAAGVELLLLLRV